MRVVGLKLSKFSLDSDNLYKRGVRHFQLRVYTQVTNKEGRLVVKKQINSEFIQIDNSFQIGHRIFHQGLNLKL